jgi:DNA-binding transcriptional ArsR family regulator/uncharacterized protein YndB with AHSA1/START domain
MNDAAYSVFKALSDPTRRQLLDLMQAGPRTTGQLAEDLDNEMSRYGVMKHLGVLERAGLVVVRREGRHRYNHLNAVPIQQIYERWVGKYAGTTATSLINLKQLAESQTGEDMSNIDSFNIAQEIEIAATRDKVWDALTKDIGQWWAMRSVEEGKGEITFDAKVGGQLRETNGNDGALWGTVVHLQTGVMLQLTGAYGLTSRLISGLITYELEERGDKTLVKLSHKAIGYELGDTGAKYTEGWKMLLGTYLKAFLEEGKTWGDVKADG